MPFEGDRRFRVDTGVLLVLGVPPSGSGEEVGGVILSMIIEVDGRSSIDEVTLFNRLRDDVSISQLVAMKRNAPLAHISSFTRTSESLIVVDV